MILVSDVNVVSRPHIVANLNTEVTNNSATAPNEAPVSDCDNWIRNAFLTRHHSG
jgi:hypothetical protein